MVELFRMAIKVDPRENFVKQNSGENEMIAPSIQSWEFEHIWALVDFVEQIRRLRKILGHCRQLQKFGIPRKSTGLPKVIRSGEKPLQND